MGEDWHNYTFCRAQEYLTVLGHLDHDVLQPVGPWRHICRNRSWKHDVWRTPLRPNLNLKDQKTNKNEQSFE